MIYAIGVRADPLDTWYPRYPLPPSTLSSVAYGNGTFVTVGFSGTILTSPDGTTWTSRSSAPIQVLNAVCYGNGTFLAVGGHSDDPFGPRILTSPDGVIWTTRSFGTIPPLYGATYGNGIFVAVGASGTILTSPNRISWTTRASGTLQTLYGIFYDNGAFVVVGWRTILTSLDAITWTSRSLGPVEWLYGIARGNDTFVAVGGTYFAGVGPTILTSPDGITWTSRSSPTAEMLRDVAYANGTFISVGESGTVLTSRDGINWTNRSSGTTASLRGISYGNRTLVAVGGAILQSGTFPVYLQNITIQGDATIQSGQSKPYQCIAHFSDGSSKDVSNNATWTILNSVPVGTYIQGNRLFAGNPTTDYPVQIGARYSENGITLSSAPLLITIRPNLKVSISQRTDTDNSFPYGRVVLSAQVTGADGSQEYFWDLTGVSQHGPYGEPDTWVAYDQKGTYRVSLRVNDFRQSDSATVYISVNAPPVPNQPLSPSPPDPIAGQLRSALNPLQPLNIETDPDWPTRKQNGLVVITHGIWSAASKPWLSDMALAIMQRLDESSRPNIVLFDWEDDADPFKWKQIIKDLYPGLYESPTVNWDILPLTTLISMTEAAADILAVGVGPAPRQQGVSLASWISTNIRNGNINPAAPVHIIGHSAGGFVAGECGLSLANILPTQQVTMLDTPCPYRSHIKSYQTFGRVERYISSILGQTTLDFATPGQLVVDGDINLSCLLAAQMCGKLSPVCTYACNQLLRIPAGPNYHRALAYSDFLDNPFTFLFHHSRAHDWYSETIRNTNANDGFYYSPFFGNAFPTAPVPLAAEPASITEEPVDEPLHEFSTFGDLDSINETYTLTEAADAGIFKTVLLPVGADTLKFSYRFTSPGDGDFLSITWGANRLLYLGPDVELTRLDYLEAEVPVSDIAAQTNTLVFTLVSRGNTNAVLSLRDIRISINPDADEDGLSNEQELLLGTNPNRSDTDGDGLSDGDEVNMYHTNPLAMDTDGDGLTDAQEIASGSNPNDLASALKITGIRLANSSGVTIDWTGNTNHLYRVNRSSTPSRDNYSTLTNGVPGIAPYNTFTDNTATNGTAFYWIEVQ